jgi:hypothetical protein
VGSTCCNYHLANVTFTAIALTSGASYSNVYNIDLDGVSGPDITIKSFGCFCQPHTIDQYITVTSTSQCEFVFTSTASAYPCPYTYVLKNNSFGDIINSSMNWSASPSFWSFGNPAPITAFYYWNPTPGALYLSGSATHYVCFRKVIANLDTIYGWINLNSTMPGGVIDYGYINTGNPNGVGLFENNGALFDVVISPNPAASKIKIDHIENANVQLMDIQGKVLRAWRISKDDNDIDLTEINNGFYFIKVYTENNSVIKKITVLK